MIDNAKVIAELERLRRMDRQLSEELTQLQELSQHEVAMVAEAPAPAGGLLTSETIVLRTGRPVLAISQDQAQLIFKPEDSKIWKERLTSAEPLLKPAIRAVGRVEVSAHPDFSWIGTGWLVAPDIIVTNRHVAREFGHWNGANFVFRTGTFGRTMGVSIDFLEEAGHAAERVAKVREILHIEDEDGPDVAFLRLVPPADLTPEIRLSENSPYAEQQVAVIGYPARDSRIPEQDLMERIFGDVYDKKRLAPGQVRNSIAIELQHDCSTLGGNSGSVVLDLATGKAVGLHFAGRFLEANYAVPSAVIAEKLHKAKSGEARRTIITGSASVTATQQAVTANPIRISCTIPIQVTVEVGTPVPQVAPGATSLVGSSGQRVTPSLGDEPGDDDLFATEGVPADYLNRRGYNAAFLGEDTNLEVPMPKVVTAADQILAFDFGGNPNESVLNYEHFSVVMNRERRMCFFSAVNINGNLARKEKRTGWRRDPRIPSAAQIQDECYGNPPKFARGHMTRREDPVWGTKEQGAQGNADSMHVTNAVPQMQTFNAGIWLGLEDYALDHTKEDDMKVCVFTGPVFRSDDPVRNGVKIPRVFWKVIAFVHDESRELSATGYSISQEKFLSQTEYVFGAYETYQRSLKWIEQKTGLSFGRLSAVDLFEDSEEAAARPLRDFRQIRFIGRR